MRGVLLVLQDQVDVPVRLDRTAHGLGDLDQDVLRAVIDDPVDRIEAQAVEAVFVEPIEDVVDRDVAHVPLGVVDRRPPGRPLLGVEVLRCVEVQVVSVRAEVIVDHVEERHQVALMQRVDQALQVVGRAVAGIGRERQHPVVTPVAPAREVGDRHQLDGGDAEVCEVVELPPQAIEGALLAERAEVQLVEHGLVPGPAAPDGVAPAIAQGIDDQARAVDIIGLAARDRIGNANTVRELVAIARAGSGAIGHQLEIAAVLAGHRQDRIQVLEVQSESLLRRRPKPEAHRAVGANRSAKGHLVGESVGGHRGSRLPPPIGDGEPGCRTNRTSERPERSNACPAE